jgi:MFS family permease
MDLVDASIVNVALPTIRTDLSATGVALEWVVSGYLLAFAAVLITMGRLGDRYGHKRLFLVGVACFGFASLGCGLAQNATQLIACRVVQGLAAATMTPQVLATFRVLFGGQERGAVFSVYGAVAGLAVAAGLLLGVRQAARRRLCRAAVVAPATDHRFLLTRATAPSFASGRITSIRYRAATTIGHYSKHTA